MNSYVNSGVPRFQMPFVKVKEMEKIFRDNTISDADILSFCDRLESDLKRKNMWEQLNSGKLHMLLEQLSQCDCISS